MRPRRASTRAPTVREGTPKTRRDTERLPTLEHDRFETEEIACDEADNHVIIIGYRPPSVDW